MMNDLHCHNSMEWGSEPELFGPLHHFRVGLMVRTLRQLLPRGRVLDAGCGAGSLIVALDRLGYTVEGVDLSQRFCQFVASLLRQEPLIGSSVVRATLERLPFHDKSFDGLLCGEVLEHVAEDKAALMEFQRVLRPGGVLVITVPVGEELWDRSDLWAGHLRRYDVRGLRQLIEELGFIVEKIKPYGFLFGRIYHQLVTKSVAESPTGSRVKSDKLATIKRLGRRSLVITLLAALMEADRKARFPSGPRGVLIAGRRSSNL